MNIIRILRHQYTLYTVKTFVLISFMIFISSCKKDNADSTIPNVPVNFTVYLNLPQYQLLNTPNNYVIVNEYGYRGIVIYRTDIENFVAFDLACPYDPTNSSAKLQVDSSGITTVDPHCGSKFTLYDGSIIHGPATRPMKPYNTDFQSSTNTVQIFN